MAPGCLEEREGTSSLGKEIQWSQLTLCGFFNVPLGLEEAGVRVQESEGDLVTWREEGGIIGGREGGRAVATYPGLLSIASYSLHRPVEGGGH